MHPAPTMTQCLRLLPLLLLCGTSTLLAQDTERSWHLGIALGQGARDNPLITGESIDINAVIDFSWYGERLFFDNGDLGYTLHDESNWSVNLVATVNNERNYYNYLTGRTFGLESLLTDHLGISSGEQPPGDSIKPERGQPEIPAGFVPATLNLATELPDRKFALNSGVEFLYISPYGDVQAQLLSDASGTHNGQEAWLSWSRPWYTRNNEFTLTLGLEWKSSDLVSYYYGVRRDEAFPGRPFYEGASGTNSFVRFAARHAFSEHWQLVGMVEREFLSAAISNSPIVDEDAVDTFFTGLFYSF